MRIDGKKRETAETVADVEVSDGGAVDTRATTYKLVPRTSGGSR